MAPPASGSPAESELVVPSRTTSAMVDPPPTRMNLISETLLEHQPVTGELAALDAEISFLDDVLDDLETRSISSNTRRSYTATWAEFTLGWERFALEPLPADRVTVRRVVADLTMQIRLTHHERQAEQLRARARGPPAHVGRRGR